MRSSGLRALVLATFAVAACAVVGLGYTASDLLAIVNGEIVPEVSIAAGANLVDYFFDNYTQEELLVEATSGLTPGIKFAATEALKRYRIFVNPFEDLIAAYTADELKAMGATSLLAAQAYYYMIRGDVTVESLSADAAGIGYLAQAAGEILGGYYTPGSFYPLTLDEAITLTETGATPGLRLAGGVALATYILLGESDYGADMSDEDLITGALAATGFDLGLAHVYETLLTQRFAQ